MLKGLVPDEIKRTPIWYLRINLKRLRRVNERTTHTYIARYVYKPVLVPNAKKTGFNNFEIVDQLSCKFGRNNVINFERHFFILCRSQSFPFVVQFCMNVFPLVSIPLSLFVRTSI